MKTRSKPKRQTATDIARIATLRDKYKARPTPEKLLSSGDYTSPVPLGAYLQIKQIMRQLKQARADAKLSLADLAKRTKIDRGYLSKLENMQQGNTTLETVSRIAEVLGLEIGLRRRGVKD